jgi:hypothetical protein
MKTIQVNLYDIDELKAQYPDEYKKAIQKEQEYNDYLGLADYMTEYCEELLKDNGITGKPTVMYSLSYCQGDGVMFEGEFEWKKYRVYIKQSGHYYHSNSKSIEIQELDNEGFDIGEDYEPKVYAEFEAIYQDICNKLEKAGYNYIDEENEEENILDNMRANEYTFESDGTMNNN